MTEDRTVAGHLEWLSKIKATMPDAAGQFGLLTIENEHGSIELKCHDPESIAELIAVLEELHNDLTEAQADHGGEDNDMDSDPGDRRVVML